MLSVQWISSVAVAMAVVFAASGQTPPPEKPLPREALSPAEAIRQPLGRPVVVEFRVGTATMGRRNDDQAKEPRLVLLAPDTSLRGGATFEVILAGKAVTHLGNLGLLGGDRPDEFFSRKLVRVS